MIIDWTSGEADQQPTQFAQEVWNWSTETSTTVVTPTGVGEVEYYRRVVDEERE